MLIRTKWRFWTSWRHFGCTLWRSQLLCSWRNFNFFSLLCMTSFQKVTTHQEIISRSTLVKFSKTHKQTVKYMCIQRQKQLQSTTTSHKYCAIDFRHVSVSFLKEDNSLICGVCSQRSGHIAFPVSNFK